MFKELEQHYNYTYCSVSSTKERRIIKAKSCRPEAEARDKNVIEIGVLSAKLPGSQERRLLEL